MLLESVWHNYVFYSTAIVCSVALALFSNTSPLLAVGSMVYVSFLGYVAHAFAHNYNYTEVLEQCDSRLLDNVTVYRLAHTFCKAMDFHEVIHHDTDINQRVVNVLGEFVLNFFNQGGLHILVILFCRYVNIYVVLLWALAYCTVHNINYDYLKPKAHRFHHIDKHTNYGIDFWDILCGTKHPDDEIEDINHYSINLVVLTAMIVLCLTED